MDHRQSNTMKSSSSAAPEPPPPRTSGQAVRVTESGKTERLCFYDICQKKLPADYVVCPHCVDATKASMCGLELAAYCSEKCREAHWNGGHKHQCGTIIEEAKQRLKLKATSAESLERLREENAKIPKVTGHTFCDGCHQKKNEELKYCVRCRSVLYCSRECQKSDWPKHRPSCKKPFTPGWLSPLYRCVLNGDIVGLQTALKYIKDNNLSVKHINYQDEQGGSSTPLYLAVEHQQHRFPMIEVLLQAGANVNQVFRGYTPLMESTFPNPGRDERVSVLTARLLLDYGADPSIMDFQGMGPLMNSCRADRPDLVRVMLEAGAEVNQRDANGATPLLVTAMDGCIRSMKVLHEYHADPDICASDGRCPLFIASENGHFECVKYLVEQMKARIDQPYVAPTGDTTTPFVAATLQSRLDIANYLKSKGASRDAFSIRGLK